MKKLEKLQEKKIKGSLRDYLGGTMPQTNGTSTVTTTDNQTCKTEKTTTSTTDNADGSSCTYMSSTQDQAAME
jgi:hypothetical protein